MAISTAAAIGVQSLPAIFGSLAQLFGKDRRKQQENAAMEQYKSVSDFFQNQVKGYGQQLDKGFSNSPEAQAWLQQLANISDKNQKNIDASSAMGGLTDEAKVAAMGKNNQAQSMGVSEIYKNAMRWRNLLMNQQAGAAGQLGNVSGQMFQAGQQNRANFNQSLANILQPMQQGINTAFQSEGFKVK